MAEGNPLQDARYAPPQAPVADVHAPTDGPLLATRWQRLGAVLIDGALAFASMWVASRVTPWDPFNVDPDISMWQPVIANVLIGFVMFALIHGVLLARRGQTLGKLVLGIRITRPDGSAASVGRVLGVRYGLGYLIASVPAFGWAFALVDSLMIFRASRRCLHDVIADTIVVQA